MDSLSATLSQLTGFDVTLDARFWAMIVIVFFAGIIRGFSGFGSALLAVPALAMIYGPVQAVVIEVLIEVPVVLGLLRMTIKEADRATVLPILSMFVLFVPVGAFLLKIIDPEIVKICISLYVLFAVALLWKPKRFVHVFSARTNYVVGAISGTTQGLAGMAGPLFATALLARNDSGERTRANIAALAAAIIACSVISFALLGLLTAELAFFALLACPAILLGVWLGAVIFRNFKSIPLREVILVFLALTAVFTLFVTLS